MSKFICPLPWVSLSLGAHSVPRVCCHQTGELDALSAGNILTLDHLEKLRAQMLEGMVPKQCRGCDELEKKGCQSPRFDYIHRFGSDASEIKIRYLDVTLNNDCNLECLMCSPLYSYKLNKLYHKELGQQRQATWQTELTPQMMKEILPTLEVITLTGGEPFVSKKILDFIKILSSDKHAASITLRVYSNLTHINSEIINLLSRFKKVELLLSIDSVEENYELIRYPASWQQLTENVRFLNKHRFPHLDIHLHAMLMSTNWNYLGELIEFYQQELGHPNHLPIFVEIETPSFMHPGILPEEQFQAGLKKMEDVLERLVKNKPMALAEINEFRKLLAKVELKKNPNLLLQYRVFLSKLEEGRKVEK